MARFDQTVVRPDGARVPISNEEISFKEGLRHSFWGRDGMRRQWQAPMKRPSLVRGELAFSERGELQGFYAYGRDNASAVHFSADILLAAGKAKKTDFLNDLEIRAINFICPRCWNTLLVWAPGMTPDNVGHETVIHWDKPFVLSPDDGKHRPTFTVDGPLSCEYLDSEITGVGQPNGGGGKCGWRGYIEAGKCYDAPLNRLVVTKR